ncbi:MAG TPA: hypothetical protein VES20_19840 [Bryobacteraceae bacterium]|nr:hypothetical protein [Bryobacteraceae bacterium]
MNIGVEIVADAAAEAAVARIREEVFGREVQRMLPDLRAYESDRILTLIARNTQTTEPVAAVSVVETTGCEALHSRFRLPARPGRRVARYTQLAVRRPFRGMDVPARLILEARRLFVVPRSCAYTWLLYDADHAKSSCLCTLLGFKSGSQTIQTEYGSSRVLFRDEAAQHAERWDRNARNHLNGLIPPPAKLALHPMLVSPAPLHENEWLAQ